MTKAERGRLSGDIVAYGPLIAKLSGFLLS
jgi:hypothetical protein